MNDFVSHWTINIGDYMIAFVARNMCVSIPSIISHFKKHHHLWWITRFQPFSEVMGNKDQSYDFVLIRRFIIVFDGFTSGTSNALEDAHKA